MHIELLILRLVHVLGGIAWVGFAAYNTFYLVPTLTEMGPAAGAVTAGLQKRKLFTVLPIIAVVTMLAGIRLMMLVAAGSNGTWFTSATGRAISFGAAASIAGFALGLAVARPAMMRSAALMAERASASADRQREIDGEVTKLRARGGWSAKWSTYLLLAAAAAMAVARYV